jgi:hypothetical protein
MSLAHAIREVSWEGSLSHESQPWPVASPSAAFPPTACPPVAASRGLPTFPFVMRRDGGPELVIRGEHPWLVSSRRAMPVLPRRRHEVSEPVEELKWGKLDDAAGARPCGLPPASRADPVGRLVSGEHVADAGDAAVSRRAAGLGETPRTSQKTTTSEGEGRRAGKGLVRAGRQEHATHEPLISSGTAADVPLAGLSLDENRCFLPSVTRARSRCIAGISTRATAFAIVPWRVKWSA